MDILAPLMTTTFLFFYKSDFKIEIVFTSSLLKGYLISIF